MRARTVLRVAVAAGTRTPDLAVHAGWDRQAGTDDRPGGAWATSAPRDEDDAGRSVSPGVNRALLLDPTGERARQGR
ncbi:MAG: hypothetical protein ACRCZD_02675 [Phycicoccus sp.]